MTELHTLNVTIVPPETVRKEAPQKQQKQARLRKPVQLGGTRKPDNDFPGYVFCMRMQSPSGRVVEDISPLEADTLKGLGWELLP